jgi:3-hydroxybutyryl-CoA dehydrogenase
VSEQVIKSLGIIGAGNQGPKIAFRCARYGLEAKLYDKSPEAVSRAQANIEAWCGESLSDAQAEQLKRRISFADSLAECVAEVDLAIEAVHENVDLKRIIFNEIDQTAPAKTLICSNSSSLPCSRFADEVNRQNKIFNINFSQPEKDTDLLVEVMRGRHTSPETMLAAEEFVRAIEMVPIITYREIMGFSFNRLWRAIKKEVLYLADQGFSDPQDIDRAWMAQFGTPFGPFGLIDIVGLEVVRDIENQYYQDSGDELDKPPQILDRMIEAGKLGVKSDQGFYSYPDPAYKDPQWLKKQGPYKEDIASKLAEIKE